MFWLMAGFYALFSFGMVVAAIMSWAGIGLPD